MTRSARCRFDLSSSSFFVCKDACVKHQFSFEHIFSSCSRRLASLASIDTMNHGTSSSTLVFLDDIAAQDLLSKAKVWPPDRSLPPPPASCRQRGEIRIILHNTSRAWSDYPYHKGYSVVCRCLISFHTVGSNNNKGERKTRLIERAVCMCVWCMYAANLRDANGANRKERNEPDLIAGLIAPASAHSLAFYQHRSHHEQSR